VPVSTQVKGKEGNGYVHPPPASPGIKRRISKIDQNRLAYLEDEFSRAEHYQAKTAKESWDYLRGRNEKGMVVDTRSLDGLGIDAYKWHVMMYFRQEDGRWLKEQPMEVVKSAVKLGTIPRLPLKITTHIIRAVRITKHVHESYKKEIEITNSILKVLDYLNLTTDQKRIMSVEEIRVLVAQLKEVNDGTLAGKKVAVKKILARSQLSPAIQKLEEASQYPDGRRAFKIGTALASLASARHWLSQKRDRQIAYISGYNLQKEYALRVKRDDWLPAPLMQFLTNPQKVYQYVESDKQKLNAIADIRKMIDDHMPTDEILAYIDANHRLFWVSERNQKDVHKRIRAIEAGWEKYDPKTKEDFQLGEYRLLYEHVNKGEKKQAKIRLKNLEIFVNANKPAFVLEELKKTNDSYMEPVVQSLEKAVDAFNAQNFELAKIHFKVAYDWLGELNKTLS
jgi:hypothetical protein